MALVAPIENGKVVETTSQSSLNKANATSNDSMDKEAFLQLLVAQMKYQDPLEPTSNTEYISQYAQFSQVEQMQNMSASMDLQRASSLVGQYVYVKTTSSTGVTNYVEGKVDYVVYENNKAYLAIDEQLYSLEDLDTVADETYLNAYNKALDLVEKVKKLPNLKTLTLSDASDVEELVAAYNKMSEYEQSFVASDVVTVLTAYYAKINELKEAAEQNSQNGNTEGTENKENTDDSGAAES